MKYTLIVALIVLSILIIPAFGQTEDLEKWAAEYNPENAIQTDDGNPMHPGNPIPPTEVEEGVFQIPDIPVSELLNKLLDPNSSPSARRDALIEIRLRFEGNKLPSEVIEGIVKAYDFNDYLLRSAIIPYLEQKGLEGDKEAMMDALTRVAEKDPALKEWALSARERIRTGNSVQIESGNANRIPDTPLDESLHTLVDPNSDRNAKYDTLVEIRNKYSGMDLPPEILNALVQAYDYNNDFLIRSTIISYLDPQLDLFTVYDEAMVNALTRMAEKDPRLEEAALSARGRIRTGNP